MGATRPGQSYLAPSTALPPTGPGRGCKGRDERGALKYLPEDGDRGGVRPQQPGRWPHLEQLVLQLQCPLSELHQRLLLAGGCCLQLSFQPLLQALVPARRSLSTQPSPNLYPSLPPGQCPTSGAGTPVPAEIPGVPGLPVPAHSADAPAGPPAPGPAPRPSPAPEGRQSGLRARKVDRHPHQA